MNAAALDEFLDAVFRDDTERLRSLLTSNPLPGPDSRNGNTPLRVASQGSCLGALRLLLEAGANPNERIAYRSPVDGRLEDGFTPLMYADSPEVVAMLLAFGADVNAVSSSGVSALVRAAHFGRADIVESLLRHGAIPSPYGKERQGRMPKSALDVAQDSLAFWESVPKNQLKPEAEGLLQAHRRTVELLRAAAAT